MNTSTQGEVKISFVKFIHSLTERERELENLDREGGVD